MPTITVEGEAPFETEPGKKLVLAIEDAGIDIMHRCGGVARCTTCRVEFLAGDPPPPEGPERQTLEEDGLLGKYRLSCQVRVADADMIVRVDKRASQAGISPGSRPED